MAARFGPNDVLLTTAGGSEPGVASRLYGAYAVLEAPDSSPSAAGSTSATQPSAC